MCGGLEVGRVRGGSGLDAAFKQDAWSPSCESPYLCNNTKDKLVQDLKPTVKCAKQTMPEQVLLVQCDQKTICYYLNSLDHKKYI